MSERDDAVQPGDTASVPRTLNPSDSCILYRNAGRDVTLLDIPASITNAQEFTGEQIHRLVSCTALETPYANNEPKSSRAKANLQGRAGRLPDNSCQSFIKNSLSLIKEHHGGDWCFPRTTLPMQSLSRKRNASDMDGDQVTPEHSPQTAKSAVNTQDVSRLLKDLSSLYVGGRTTWTLEYLSVEGVDQDRNMVQTFDGGIRVSNPSSAPARLCVTSQTSASWTFHIPPRAAFLLGDCAQAERIHSAVKDVAQDHGSKRQFDLIIMDPPWPNTSVKRGHQRGSGHYHVSDTLWDLRQLVFDMDIDVMLSHGGLIGIWVTNNAAVRDLVLGDDGFFESWGVSSIEEWIWVKVTRQGEPVMALESLWRKPYESLLLGRKNNLKAGAGGVPDETSHGAPVKRRLIAAVPDLHSRKPCLKELIEPLLLQPHDYRALEIFARYLVAGWWSWGNEVIKFNHEDCWTTHGVSGTTEVNQEEP